MLKPIVILVTSGAILSIAYFAGVFVTSFDSNLCYSNAIADVAQEATDAIKDGIPSKVTAFETFAKKLPLYGYETNCNTVTAAIERYRKSRK